MQNNPDPDAIASAAAFRDLVHQRLHKRVTIGYAGICGRAENQAMLRVLGIDAKPLDPNALDRYKTLCLVDTQPQAGNNALYTARPADIVIDHHVPARKRRPVNARFADIRPDFGATATILYEYALAAEMNHPATWPRPCSTVSSRTRSSWRAKPVPTTPPPTSTCSTRPTAGNWPVSRRAPLPASYFALLHEGLDNSVVAGRLVLTSIGDCGNPEMIAELADMMLRLEDIRYSVCYGVCEGRIYFSARTVDGRGNVAERVRRVAKGIGSAGGHRSMAAGQVPVQEERDRRLALVRERILKVFAPAQDPAPFAEKGRPSARGGAARVLTFGPGSL